MDWEIVDSFNKTFGPLIGGFLLLATVMLVLCLMTFISNKRQDRKNSQKDSQHEP